MVSGSTSTSTTGRVGRTHTLARQAPNRHAQQVVVVARERAAAFVVVVVHRGLVLARGAGRLGRPERTELKPDEVVDDGRRLAARDLELAVDKHLDEAGLVRKLLVLILEVGRHVVLSKKGADEDGEQWSRRN